MLEEEAPSLSTGAEDDAEAFDEGGAGTETVASRFSQTRLLKMAKSLN